MEEDAQVPTLVATPPETPKSVTKSAKPITIENARFAKPTVSSRKRVDPKSNGDSITGGSKATAIVSRRNSTGGVLPKKSVLPNNVGASVRKIATPSRADPLRHSLPETGRRISLPSATGKSAATISDTKKLSLESPAGRHVRAPITSQGTKQDAPKRPTVKPVLSVSSRRLASISLDDVGSSGSRKSAAKVSSPSTRSPSISSGLRSSVSSSLDRKSSLSGRKNARTPDSKDSKFMMLPQVEVKASDDVRLDLRGHRIRTLNASGLNLSPNLEFVYLRDNLLSTLDGIEILSRVKVLDLSFNDFKGPGFEPLENCKALQQLYLAGNQITSLASLPQLPNLEFLSVAQNKLKSLAMASQPRLQVLAASKNKISTLKGFPHLPVLEHLRVEENPILKMAHVEAASILLIGPTLKKFNDRDLLQEEVALAKRYPPHAAFCIRDGWEFCRPELAADSTFQFLVDQWKDRFPPGYLLKDASIDKPFEEDACFCHFIFVKESSVTVDTQLSLKYQWFIGDRTAANFNAIPDATSEVYWPKNEDVSRILKVECTPLLGDAEYPCIFAISSPVSAGTKIPKVVSLEVNGELVEGNVVKGKSKVAWCGGTPGKGVASWLRRRWNSSPVVISGAEDEEYKLTIDDIGTSLVFMYTPVTQEGGRGEAEYKYTDFIKAAPPSVSNVGILGDIVEGNLIKGVGDYFGGKEGPSKYEWQREHMETGEFVSVSKGTPEYALTKEDVGLRLLFIYVPVNFEGQEGESVSILSQIVKRAPPKVMNVRIWGDLKENSKITVAGNVTGGSEGSSRVQWFKTSSSVLDRENSLEALSTSKTAKAFRIPLGAIGYYIVAKYTPMTPDGESGEPAYAISERPIETLPPSLNFLSITGEYAEGGILTASYGYVGGHEGKSIYNWYLHEVQTDSGALVSEASGFLQYSVTKDAIGKFISFECIPVRDDGIIGEPRICMGQERLRPGSPRLLSLKIVGDLVEGTTLCVNKRYWGGEEGESTFRWFRTNSDGTQTEIKGATASSYKLSFDEIGCFVSVSCEPIRNDWARGPVVLSEQVGPVIPGNPTCNSLEFLGSIMEGQRISFIASYIGGERGDCLYEWLRLKDNGVKEKLSTEEFLDLTLDDVGWCIELVYTPIRNDGVRGSLVKLVSDAVTPADPLGLSLVIPDCCENVEVIPQKRYFGGLEGNSECAWFRVKNKLHQSDLMDAFNNHCGVVVCGKNLTYKPVLEDVGEYLALYWLPIRADNKRGKPLVAISNCPVIPAHPTVSNVHVKKLSSSAYSGDGEYFGGIEGPSLFSWYRENADGSVVLIDGANSKSYEVTDSDYNCNLLFGYMPVRSDSFVGELKLSAATDIIFPEELKVDMLAITGKAVEGEVLTAVEVIPKSGSQEHVWSKYKKDAKYKWLYSSEVGDTKSFEPLRSDSSCRYKVQFEDVGRCLRCECIVTDIFGRSTEPSYAETSPVLPGIPRIGKMEIEGRGFHTNLYAVHGIYSGGREGKSKIQWLRSMIGSPDLISIPGETGKMYEANVDDVGYRLVAIYTPIREDGVEGQPMSASTESIAVEPDVLKEVKQKLEIGSVKFEVLCDKEGSSKRVGGSSGSLERRMLEINRKRIKVVKPGSKTSFPTTEIRGSYSPPFHVEVLRNEQHRLRIVVDGDNEMELMVQSRHLRDVIVLVIRGMAQRFNSTSLNSLLKIET